MNTFLEQINRAGSEFVGFAWPMLIQSSVLIVILLAADFLLRKRVRAVVRYWVWMLVLVKLFLPTSLWSPVSVGNVVGDKLASVTISGAVEAGGEKARAETSPALLLPEAVIGENTAGSDVEPAATAGKQEEVTAALQEAETDAVTSVTWQGVVFLAWLSVAAAMVLLLLQRAMFVCGLVRQATSANGLMTDTLRYCCKVMGIKGKIKIGLKVSANATSPAVCGLFRPTVLVPQNLGSSLGANHLRTVLLHELAHIKRGDLWVNLIQTLLQIAYFYSPLLWVANWMIRRVREQAVDEAVLVAMGDKAREYPQTLLNVAKLAFERPALSLRLIGVVESKSALTGRIKRILARPVPKSAKLGFLGLVAVFVIGAVLLPMAKARTEEFILVEKDKQVEDSLEKIISAADFGKDEDVVERRRQRLRREYERRIAQDRATYGDAELGEIEELYQRGDLKWGSEEFKQQLEKLVARYEKANRTGCAVMYLARMSEGKQKERYLKRAIEKFEDCWYGDGAQVGAMARLELGLYYMETGREDEAVEVFAELRRRYRDAVGHKGNLLVEQIPRDGTMVRAKSAKQAKGERNPVVVRTNIKPFDNSVSASLDKITVTFDQRMMDKSWSFTTGPTGRETYPKTTGAVHYDRMLRTCTMPVKLEPAKVYYVGINEGRFNNFKSARGVPAKSYAIVFATKGTDGSATEIPRHIIDHARAINENAVSKVQLVPAVSGDKPSSGLQQMIDAARAGGVVTIPAGTYTEPIKIGKALTIKGESRDDCVFEVTANEPAILIDTKGRGKVTVEDVTIRWQLTTSDKNIEYPFAVGVKDTRAEIKGCRFEPLGNFRRSPEAVRALGFSNMTLERCRFEGFEYVVCYGEGTEGLMQDCLIMDCGHQGVILYSGAKVKVLRNVITASGYHAVRSTGGELDMRDNLIIGNKNRGVYLGNKSAKGTITNNAIIRNTEGISGFAQSDVRIENNVIADSSYAGIGMRSSCSLTIRDNIFVGNDRGWIMSEDGGKGGNTCLRNTFWKNKVDAENFAKTGNSILADPVFADPEKGDFSLEAGPAKEKKQGLTEPEIFKKLWKQWEKRKDKNEPFI